MPHPESALSRVAPTVDAVLLSHPDLAHLGALPYAAKHLGLTAPVYATTPVQQLGIFFLYEAYAVRIDSSEKEWVLQIGLHLSCRFMPLDHLLHPLFLVCYRLSCTFITCFTPFSSLVRDSLAPVLPLHYLLHSLFLVFFLYSLACVCHGLSLSSLMFLHSLFRREASRRTLSSLISTTLTMPFRPSSRSSSRRQCSCPKASAQPNLSLAQMGGFIAISPYKPSINCIALLL